MLQIEEKPLPASDTSDGHNVPVATEEITLLQTPPIPSSSAETTVIEEATPPVTSVEPLPPIETTPPSSVVEEAPPTTPPTAVPEGEGDKQVDDEEGETSGIYTFLRLAFTSV